MKAIILHDDTTRESETILNSDTGISMKLKTCETKTLCTNLANYPGKTDVHS